VLLLLELLDDVAPLATPLVASVGLFSGTALQAEIATSAKNGRGPLNILRNDSIKSGGASGDYGIAHPNGTQELSRDVDSLRKLIPHSNPR